MTFTPTDTLLLSALLPTAANQQCLCDLLADNKIDWALAVQKSLAGGTAALLRYNLTRAALLDAVPPPERERLAQESHLWAAKQQIYTHETRQFIAALQARGIPSLPLKGAALMLGGYYPLPGLRAAVDVDLLIAPEQVEAAFAVALEAGFKKVVIKKPERVPIPLPYELRHLPLLRNRRGVALELHYRAFHDLRQQRDFAWAEMIDRAVGREGVYLPAAEDLALHLIQHSIVDLTSAHAILRTLADVYFLLAAEPRARERLIARGDEFALRGAVTLTLDAVRCLAEGTLAQCEAEVGLLLEAALVGATPSFFEAARLFEYLDLRQRPVARLKHLYALLTTPIQTSAAATQVATSRLRRLSALWRRLRWQGAAWADLRRVMKLRKITLRK